MVAVPLQTDSDPAVNHLFKAMFEAEGVGDHDLAARFKDTIKQVLLGEIPSREDFLVEFMRLLAPDGHSPKKVWTTYEDMKTSKFSPIKLAVQLSSFISWSLQAVEKISPVAYIYLQIPRQIKMLSDLIDGNLSQAQILEFYAEIFDPASVQSESPI